MQGYIVASKNCIWLSTYQYCLPKGYARITGDQQEELIFASAPNT